MLVSLHAVEHRSKANGPGTRCVIWFQGCTLNCPGCFNPTTHSSAPQRRVSVDQLLVEIASASADIQGLTLTGGEPFQQPHALRALLRGVRETTSLSVLVFSGYTLEEIRRQPLGCEILRDVDVLIDGRYSAAKHHGRALRGSSNQRIHLLTRRYTLEEIESTPAGEVRVDTQGRIVLSGVDPLRLSG